MEIRELNIEQLPEAIDLAKRVFDVAFGDNIDPNMRFFFIDYARVEKLQPQMENKEVILFGAYEGDTLMGVSAMQRAGHITMLYVDAPYLRRGVSKALLAQMYKYANEVLKVDLVTTSVFPYRNVELFKKQGFVIGKDFVSGMPYVPMCRSVSAKIMTIPRRKIKWKAWLLTLLIVVILILLVTFALTLDYFM